LPKVIKIMKFWIEKDDTIFLYQLIKAAGLEDDYAVIRQVIRNGKVSLNDQVALNQRQEVKAGDTIQYNSVHVKILEKKPEEKESNKVAGYPEKNVPEEPIKHGGAKKWSSKPLHAEQKLDDQIKQFVIQLHKTLIGKKLTLALAESCTGGMAQEFITSLPGASDFFLGGIVSYSNDIKTNILQVKGDSLKKYGAVSGQVASEMAAGVKELFVSDLSGSITGVAGPAGGTVDKPVGCVYIAISNPQETINKKYLFSGDRDKIRKKSVLELFKFILENV